MPAPFRVHDRPPEAKYADLLEYLTEFGLRLPPWGTVQPRDFTTLLQEDPQASRCRPAGNGAAAFAEPGGVLAREQGPLRPGAGGLRPLHLADPPLPGPAAASRDQARADQAAARTVSATRRRKWPTCALQCSEKERRADEAEREVDERYRSAWMEKHVGSEFDGVISGVTSFGLFVELVESKVNGLVHVTQLPHDYYHFDPLRKTLRGERKGAVLPPRRSGARAGAEGQRRGQAHRLQAGGAEAGTGTEEEKGLGRVMSSKGNLDRRHQCRRVGART